MPDGGDGTGGGEEGGEQVKHFQWLFGAATYLLQTTQVIQLTMRIRILETVISEHVLLTMNMCKPVA